MVSLRFVWQLLTTLQPQGASRGSRHDIFGHLRTTLHGADDVRGVAKRCRPSRSAAQTAASALRLEGFAFRSEASYTISVGANLAPLDFTLAMRLMAFSMARIVDSTVSVDTPTPLIV